MEMKSLWELPAMLKVQSDASYGAPNPGSMTFGPGQSDLTLTSGRYVLTTCSSIEAQTSKMLSCSHGDNVMLCQGLSHGGK